MKTFIKTVFVFCLAVIVTGCFSSHMTATTIKSDDIKHPSLRGGRYYVEACNNSELLDSLRKIKDNKGNLMFTDKMDESSVPISIKYDYHISDNNTLAYEFYDLLCSALTLGILPWYQSSKLEGYLTLELEIAGNKTFNIEGIHRWWASFLNPFCIIPVPGLADKREFNTNTMADNDECSIRGNDYSKIAEAIANSLLQSDYDKVLAGRSTIKAMESEQRHAAAERAKQEMYNKRITLPLGKIIDFNELERKDSVMKDFAVREMPSVWNTIQKLKIAAKEQDEKVKKFESDLMKLGRVPENEPKYVKTCENRYQLVELLKSVYKNLEDAYIAAQHFEVSVGDKKLESIKNKTIEDGIREAEMASRRYEQLMEEK